MNTRILLILSLIYLLISLSSYFLPEENNLKITFFDVGQGDAIYIKMPTGERVLIDGGENNTGDYKINKEFIFPFCNLDLIFITHPHADHMGGLPKILQRCNFGALTFNDISCDSNTCAYFRGINNKKTVLIGDIYNFNNVTLKVLWPDLENTNVDYSNANNLSVVVFLDYGDFEALFTGDAEKEALSQIDVDSLLPYIQNGLDIYKISHHGAINGLYTPLLDILKPKECVISVGEGNSYGHPNADVLNYLESINCNISRTDQLGDITFIF